MYDTNTDTYKCTLIFSPAAHGLKKRFPQNLFILLMQIIAYKELRVAAAQKINPFLKEFEREHQVKVTADTSTWAQKK